MTPDGYYLLDLQNGYRQQTDAETDDAVLVAPNGSVIARPGDQVTVVGEVYDGGFCWDNMSLAIRVSEVLFPVE
jgi:hypothetical protein